MGVKPATWPWCYGFGLLAQWLSSAAMLVFVLVTGVITAANPLVVGPAPRRRRRWSRICGIRQSFFPIMLAVFMLRAFCRAVSVPSPSMCPGLVVGISSWSTIRLRRAHANHQQCADPGRPSATRRRGEVHLPPDPVNFIKRAPPGDTVSYRDKLTSTVNGALLPARRRRSAAKPYVENRRAPAWCKPPAERAHPGRPEYRAARRRQTSGVFNPRRGRLPAAEHCQYDERLYLQSPRWPVPMLGRQPRQQPPTAGRCGLCRRQTAGEQERFMVRDELWPNPVHFSGHQISRPPQSG